MAKMSIAKKEQAGQVRFEWDTEYKIVYTLRPESFTTAADLMLDLIKETGAATWEDIAKRRLGIPIDREDIPVALVKVFADHVEVLKDEHLRIKSRAEELGGVMLKVVDKRGRSTLRGSAPFGVVEFTAGGADAGIEDERAQAKMAVGKLRAVARRSGQAGHMVESRQIQLIAAIDAIGAELEASLPLVPLVLIAAPSEPPDDAPSEPV